MKKKAKKDKKKRPVWKKVLLTALCVVLALILVIGIFATVYINYLLSRVNRVDPENESTVSSSEAEQIILDDPDIETIDPNSTETYVDISDITFPTEETQPQQPADSGSSGGTQQEATAATEASVYGDHLVNILLVGQDRREGQGRQRSDTMILVSFNKAKNTITLTSFMRDMYVQIPGYSPNKMNAAYAFGGMSLLSKTFEVNFGVKIDGIVEVDFSGFEKVIDLLGGVDITLTAAEAQYLSDCGENVAVGSNHLSGAQALMYARLREIDSDYKRTTRQRNVIQALMTAYKNRPLDEMLSLLDDILPLVTTNMTNSQIIGYATDLFSMLSSASMETMRIPVDGTFSSGKVKVREGLVAWFQYNIDFAANKKVLYGIFSAE